MVRFRSFREYEEHKAEANNAMMALLAGAQLSAHLLRLSEGSERLLPEVFPAVEHIHRFSLKPDRAREILLSADAHLGKMAVPYVLALHEDYMRTCLGLLHANNLCSKASTKGNLVDLHPSFETVTGHVFNEDMKCYMTALRLMRNAVIHNGSTVTEALQDELALWTPQQEKGWLELAKRNPRTLQVGDRIDFGHGEMIAALAITKRLDREANLGLQAKLSRPCWAKMVFDEVFADHPQMVGNPKALRTAKGVARHHYAPLQLTDAELSAELASRN
ncbi:hypothetical protein KHQ06_25435 [Nocardia tengchongensis]|uniref:Uncharacterized protein n=1 Tax=Nocardia tengchongensis TaxID=2055889 RepID=A0ABX8CI94_9NOCA|nr:hypothetical protein [Nocardia tengchongensis]QVI19686.1 hypothetical protein KHQ06_25435 [Nocardia tengchongensis]